ncbi:predicted protein [Nematostella vectensis]|uniref:Nocturnin n=1 Tax=Nematostella vectensis TaxID=45351 RepID=A7SLA8_NEMVE|nr:predicted protein [Nematostella vectensis]|eukprot:XP_001627560.1 predicted protein [Nematostella vectensis]
MASSSKDSASCSEDSVSSLAADLKGMTLGQGTVFKVMSINIGKHKKDDKKEQVHTEDDKKRKGLAQQKREKVVDLLNEEKPDLVFLQECSSARELENSLPPSFKCAEGAVNDTNKSCSCIVFNEDNIEVKPFGITHLYLKENAKLSDEEEFLERLKDGKGGLRDEKKKNIFSELLILLDEVCNKAECKVLVGGGFNLKYAKAEEVVQEGSNQYNLYTKGSQGKPMDDMVDYFMYNGPPGDVRNVRVGDAIDLFYHKPLYADFKLK